MPIELNCKKCESKFSVGRYHYHSLVEGFSGRCLLVCVSCGRQHAIEFALLDRGCEFNEVYRVIIDEVSESARKYILREIRRQTRMPILEASELLHKLPLVICSETNKNNAERLYSELLEKGSKVRLELIELWKNPNYGPIKSDRLLYASEPLNINSIVNWEIGPDLQLECRDDLSQLVCQCCSSVGTLTDEIEVTSKCPVCNASELYIASEWLT